MVKPLKPCRRCGGHKQRGTTSSYCCSCMAIPAKERHSRWKKDPEHMDRKLLASVRTSSWKQGLECTVQKSDLLVPKTCPILGIPLFFSPGKRTPNTPSVDRIDCSRGYTPDNVVVVSWRANELKRDATLDELQKLATFYGALLR